MAHEGQKVAGEYWILKLSEDNGATWLQLICEKGSDIKFDRAEIDASSKCGTDKSPGLPTQSLSTDFYLISGANVGGTEASYKKMFDWYVSKLNLRFMFGASLKPGVIFGWGTIVGGTGYTNGTYLAVPLIGGHGTGATANITVAGGVVTVVALDNVTHTSQGYLAADSMTVPVGSVLGAGTGFTVAVNAVLPGFISGDLSFTGLCWIKNLNLTAKNQERISITSEVIIYPDDTVLTATT